MSICVISQHTAYNVREGGFRKGWDMALHATRSKQRTRPSKCGTCQIQSLCGMCPANGELENNDAESPVDFLCQVAHLRTMALGSEVPAHGDCECCKAGSSYEELQAAVTQLPATIEQLSIPAKTLLPILSSATASNSCGGRCGH
jgi:radical SAM protein with 4Fe4S-binding SPASM domain